MNIRERWAAFAAKCEDQRFKDAKVLWTGQGGDITQLPVPPKAVDPYSHAYLLQIQNHNYIRFTIIDGLELNSIKGKTFNPYNTNGYTARLEY